MNASSNIPQQNVTDPAIRLFQFDSDALGAVKKSVNLFRGDVNMPLSLVTLPGRNDFDVDIKIVLQSNVRGEVDAWNLTNPTGVLGLGWTLSIEKITTDNNNGDSDTLNQYYYSSGTSTDLLVPSDISWLRLTLPLIDKDNLDEGDKPDETIIQAFADAGILLDGDSKVTVLQSGESWTLTDSANQIVYQIEATDTNLEVYDGGQAYQRKAYQFWRIFYYPQFERWAITREDGRTSSFGGISESEGNGSINNSIEWGVKWSNWFGNSGLTATDDGPIQQQFANSWYLAETTDNWGEGIVYTYETLEQAVGQDGLNYTKATYLKTITDTFNREITFNYEAKTYDASSSAGIREYADPHKLIPDNEPNSFQDRYKTLYLDSIAIYNEQALLLYTIKMTYELKNVSQYANTDAVYGDTFKRYLTAFNLEETDGEMMPGMEFGYEWSNDPATNRGGITEITYPQGGKATYTYEKVTIDNIKRDYQIDNPFATQAKPRTWFGRDYAVSTWYLDSATNPELKLSIFTWVAGWQQWEASIEEFKHTINLDTLEVTVQDTFIVVSFYSEYAEQYQVFLLHKNADTFDQWYTFQPETNAFGSKPPRIVAGDRFALIAFQDDSLKEEFSRFTWDLNTKMWIEDSPDGSDLCNAGLAGSNQKFYAVGKGNYYAVLCYDLSGEGKNRMQWFYHDINGNWFSGASTEPEFVIAQTGDTEYFRMSPSDSSVVASVITSFGTSPQYSTFIFQWTALFAEIKTTTQSGTLQKFVPIGPDLSDDSIVGFGPEAFRYNGDSDTETNGNVEGWLAKDLPVLLQGVTDQKEVYRWTAAGPNYILQTANGENSARIQLASFDPDTDIEAWDSALQTVVDSNQTLDYRANRFFVSAGGEDFFTADGNVYFRITSNSTTWSSIEDHNIYTLGSELSEDYMVNTTTIQNNAPFFIAYAVEKSGIPFSTSMVLLRNGAVVTDENGDPEVKTLEGQFLFEIFDASQGSLRDNLNGKVPNGPLSFYTTPKSNIDESPSITIYRYAQQDITGALTDFRVKSVEVDDGYDNISVLYDYEDSTAGFDPFGKVAKYFKITSYQGTTSIEDAQNGYVVTEYYNGLTAVNQALAEEAPVDNFTILDGLLISQSTYNQSDELILSRENTWEVYDQILVKKNVDDAGTMTKIFGNWVRQVSSKMTLDSVPLVIDSTYDSATGQLASQTNSYYGSEGTIIEQKKDIIYGGNVYDWLFRKHLLKTEIQTKVSQGENTTKVDATPFIGWNNELRSLNLQIYAPAGKFSWRGSGSPDFDFTNWSPTSQLDDWRKDAEYLERNANGLVTESQINGLQINTIGFSNDAELAVYTSQNALASQQEVAYYGFEDYEVNPGWTLNSNTVEGIAHTGSQSLEIPSGSSEAASIEFSPENTSQEYVFYCWYRTEDGFSPTSGSGFTLQQKKGGDSVGNAMELPFVDTKGDWVFISGKIDLSENQATGVSIFASNQSNKTAYIDNLVFSPVVSSVTATIYDAAYRLPIATVGPWNNVTRKIYNRFLNEIGHINAANNIESVNLPFLSRKGVAAKNAFDSSHPNSQANLYPTGDGFYQDFRIDPDWQKYWSATSGNWQILDGQLANPDSGAAVLTANESTTDQGICLKMIPNETLSGGLGLSIGRIKIQWEPSSNEWQLLVEGDKVLSQSAADFQQNLCMITSGANTIFWIDSQRIFSYTDSEDVSGAITIEVNDKVSLADIMVFSGVQVKVDYANGFGKTIQNQMLTEKESLVGVTLYDEIGRTAVTTKMAFLSPDGDFPLLAYRTSAVTALDWDTGVMQGDIADAFPDDNGYPYSRKLYEASPSKRVVEEGQPGEEFAITNISTTSADDRHTTKYMYSANQDGDGFADLNFPEGQYLLRTTIDPDGVNISSIQDTQGGQLASNVLMNADTDSYITSSSQNTVDSNAVYTAKYFMPSYYDINVPDNTNFITEQQFNALGQAQEHLAPDSGKTTFIYDDAGRLRFSQDAEAAVGTILGTPYITYIKYDELGRKLETGILPYDWGDGSALQKLAETDVTFPDSGQTITKTFQYGTDNTDVNQFARLTQTQIFNIMGSKAIVTTTLEYDVLGDIITHSESVSEYNSNQDYVLKYQFNNQRSVSQIDYLLDGNDSSYTVQYVYDLLGQIAQINGGQGALAEIASFTYNDDGAILNETLNPGADNEIIRTMSYNSPGWLKKIDNDLFSEELTYTDSGYNGAGFYNQNIASIASTYGGVSSPDFLSSVDYKFDYDALKRLTVAECESAGDVKDQYSLGINDMPIQFDDNGNILQITLGDNTSHYEYDNGTDQLLATDNAEQITYSPRGAVTSSPTKQINAIAYGPNSHLPESITMSDGTDFDFATTSKNRRVWKSDLNDTTDFYVYGLNPFPVMHERSSNGEKERTLLIYGPSGLLFIQNSSDTYTLLKDHSGSTRALVDSNREVASAYNYLPFGAILDQYQASGVDPEICSVLFHGHEFDWDLGLYNDMARLYDQDLGVFYDIDPKGDSISPYAFVHDNPISYVDVTGQSANVFGILFSVAEIAVGGFLAPVGIGIALTANGALGLAYTIRADDDFSVGNFFKVQVSAGISEAEIAAAVAIDLFSDGTLAPTAGAALLGAGISGLLNTGEQVVTNENGEFSMTSFFEDQAIGFVTGAITGGFGSIGGIVGKSITTSSKVIVSISENLGETAAKGAVIASRVGVAAVAGSVGGASAATVKSGADLLFGKSDSFNANAIWQGALFGAVIGGASGGFKLYGDNLSPQGSKPAFYLRSIGNLEERKAAYIGAAKALSAPIGFNAVKIGYAVNK